MIKGKNGSVRDVLLISILVFVIVVVFFVIHFIGNSMFDSLISADILANETDTLDVFTATKEMTGRLDYVAFAFFIGLIIALIVTGYFVAGHSLFMFIYFLVVCFAIAMSAILSNVWETLSTNATLLSSVASFPIMNHVLNNFPLYISGVGILGLIVMFAKPTAQ